MHSWVSLHESGCSDIRQHHDTGSDKADEIVSRHHIKVRKLLVIASCNEMRGVSRGDMKIPSPRWRVSRPRLEDARCQQSETCAGREGGFVDREEAASFALVRGLLRGCSGISLCSVSI